jgi:hypothetical protein
MGGFIVSLLSVFSFDYVWLQHSFVETVHLGFNPLTPELNPTTQRCLTKFFTGDFPS